MQSGGEFSIIEAADYFRLSIASSNLIFEGMKSIYFTNSVSAQRFGSARFRKSWALTFIRRCFQWT